MNLFVFIRPNLEYELDFVASDSDMDDIYYFIDWGDGATTDWLGPFPTSEHILVKHTWTSNLKFGTIKARAKDIHGSESADASLFYFTIKSRADRPNIILQRIMQRLHLDNGFLLNLLLLIKLSNQNKKNDNL